MSRGRTLWVSSARVRYATFGGPTASQVGASRIETLPGAAFLALAAVAAVGFLVFLLAMPESKAQQEPRVSDGTADRRPSGPPASAR
jgi:hypothetical protein